MKRSIEPALSIRRPSPLRPLLALLVATAASACNCDPASPAGDGGVDGGTTAPADDDAGALEPDAGGDDAGQPDAGDAGGEDAGEQDAGEDAGPPPAPVAVQSENGIVSLVDLESGDVSHPFGAASANGGVAANGEVLFTFSETFRDVQGRGNVVSVDPDTLDVSPGPELTAAPETIAAAGQEVATSEGIGASIRAGSFELEGPLPEHPTTFVGSSVAFAAGELVVSTNDGLVLTETATTIVTDPVRVCTGLDYDPDADAFLCADRDGIGVWSITRSGEATAVEGAGPADFFTSLTRVSGGGFIAPRRDCTVSTSASLPDDIESFCPQQFAEHDGRLFFVSRVGGGLYEIDGAGEVRLRLVAATTGKGLAFTQGRYAISGAEEGVVEVAMADGSEPWRSALPFEANEGLVLDREGGLWVGASSGVLFFDGDAAPVTIASASSVVDLARVGTALYAAVSDGTVHRLSLADGAAATLEDTTLPTPALLGGCARALVFYDEDTDVIGTFVDDASASWLDDASSELGEITAVGCSGDFLLAGSGDGSVWRGSLDVPGAYEELAELSSPARRFASTED